VTRHLRHTGACIGRELEPILIRVLSRHCQERNGTKYFESFICRQEDHLDFNSYLVR
jgi:hypothetical protein